MQIRQLIEILKTKDQNLLVMVEGYEGGLSDVSEGLRSPIVRYCKKNSLPLPAGKRGRKEMVKNFKLKGE